VPAALAVLLATALLAAPALALAAPAAGRDVEAERHADAEYPPLPLTALLPALPLPLPLLSGGGQATTGSCPDGEVACVDAVVDGLRGRVEGLLSTCHHHAAFALTYLRVTEAYRRAATDPGFFTDTPFVNHHAVVFAEVYFRAADAWRRGDREEVPPAWRIALSAADDGRVSAVGDLLLGLGAHINRDLPFVLAALGLRRPDGGSRKPDHDRVNAILRAVTGPILTEVAERLDPAAATARVDGTDLDESTLFQLLALWREEAWRNAELLAAAPTPTARALIAQTIEITAALKQQALLTATAYRPPLTSNAARATWCRTHG
jgi:hypothetical protein